MAEAQQRRSAAKVFFSQRVQSPVFIGREATVERFVITSLGGFFPVIAQHPDGTLAIVARDGDIHVGQMGRLGIATSPDGGVSWSRLQPVADEGVDLRNPGFGITSKGRWILAYMEMDSYINGYWSPTEKPSVGRVFFRISEDGETWSDPQRIDVGGYPVACPFGKIVELGPDHLLMSLYGGNRSYVIRSRDGGATWSDISVIAEGYNETALLALPSGRILAALRSSGGDNWAAGIHLAYSLDEARSWSKPVPVTGEAQHPADLLLLRDGRVVLSYGHRRPPYGVRAVVSLDEGATWDHDNTLVLVADSSTSDCGYPSSVQLPNGDIFTAYYAKDSLSIKQGARYLLGVHAAGVRYSPALFDQR